MGEKTQKMAGWVATVMDWFSREPAVATADAPSRRKGWRLGGVVLLILLLLQSSA